MSPQESCNVHFVHPIFHASLDEENIFMIAITKSVKQFYHKYDREKREQKKSKNLTEHRILMKMNPFPLKLSYQKRSSLLK